MRVNVRKNPNKQTDRQKKAALFGSKEVEQVKKAKELCQEGMGSSGRLQDRRRSRCSLPASLLISTSVRLLAAASDGMVCYHEQFS